MTEQMAHPSLALSDPMYWLALLVLLATVAAVPWALRRPRRLKTGVVVALLVLCLPSGCYALLGTACYVGGSCP